MDYGTFNEFSFKSAKSRVVQMPNLCEGRKEMVYLMMHSTHFIYCYMASDSIKDYSDIEDEKRSRHYMTYCFRLATWDLT